MKPSEQLLHTQEYRERGPSLLPNYNADQLQAPTVHQKGNSSSHTHNSIRSASSTPQRNAGQPLPQLSCPESEDQESEPPIPSATPAAELLRLTIHERLERAYSTPVVFALKALLAYDGDLDQDSPLPGRTVKFRVGDFLHIKEVRACSLVSLY